ncbi:hypothetical protein SAMN05660895_0928 [Thermoflavifilum thermophilum]|uniref:Uncharacterized protein n=1 Tax=Thermoflavifilum thermophilum TaxID=1393122 RepID=A0A1I7N8C2_9BACT|nr:hypothetical protein SAMN05660895_0928 [Thermoflavifilum thermophilum]
MVLLFSNIQADKIKALYRISRELVCFFTKLQQEKSYTGKPKFVYLLSINVPANG